MEIKKPENENDLSNSLEVLEFFSTISFFGSLMNLNSDSENKENE